jgi:hypothetical protein
VSGRKVFTAKEVAEVMLFLIDAQPSADLSSVGVYEREYIGQGVHKIYVERDNLLRLAERDY